MSEFASVLKLLADDGARTLPVACRLVPLDQWLVTHVDTSWKVKDIKQWILSKCNVWESSSVPQPPKFRPASPVTFSALSRRSSLDSESWAGTEEGGDEDDWDAFAAVDYNAELRVSDAPLASVSGKSIMESSVSEHGMSMSSYYAPSHSLQRTITEREFDATSAQYTLVSFSNGFILEDDANLSWYKLRPFEMIEVHRAGGVVSLPRSGPKYIEPYFESPVRVSERPHKRRSGRTSQEHQAHSVEWKPRWAIIRDGILHICKDTQTPPTHRFPISALSVLDGSEHFGLGEKSPSNRIICAKFNRASMYSGVISEGVEAVVSPSQGEKKLKSSSWVILEMPNRSSYESLLRILHRLAPFPLMSSFVPAKALKTPNEPLSPRHRFRSSVSSPVGSVKSFESTPSAFFGVQYPEWRLALVQKCQAAGRGAIGNALSLAQAYSLYANSGSYDLYHHILPRAPSISEGLRRRAEQASSSAGSEDEDANSGSDSGSVHPWKEALSDEEGDDEDDDVESEIEWEGWVRDLARRPTRPPPLLLSPPLFPSPLSPASPSSPTSSEAGFDLGESSGTTRVRTLSYATNPSGPISPRRARSSTVSAAGTAFGSTYTYTSTTTTTITTYLDRIPDLRILSSVPGTWTHQSYISPPSSPPPSSPSPRDTPRARRMRGQAGSPARRTGMGFTPPQSGSGSRADSVPASEDSSGAGDASVGSGRNMGMGGVKRIVRGVSIRNAFSTERFARGLEDALDFVDGR